MSSATVIVFQEDCILAAMGTEGALPSLTRVKRIDLSGTGDAFDRWEQALQNLDSLWKEEPVSLVLPADMSSTRVLSIPYGKGKQLSRMAVQELNGSFRNEIADYSVVYRDKAAGVDLCAGGADRGVLERFLKLCEDAGFQIKGITVPMEGSLHILERTGGFQDETAIYLFFEEGSMTSILCQNGRCLYSGRSRLFSERGTLDFGTEIVRSISGILQFAAGNRRDLQITQVYYAGCPEEDFEVSVQGIKELSLQVEPLEIKGRIPLPDGKELSEWLPCIGAMMWKSRREKRMDLYEAVLADMKEDTVSEGVWKQILVPGILLGVGLFITAVLGVFNWNQNREIRGLEDWMESPKVQAQYQEALDLQNRLQEIEGGIGAVDQMKKNLSVYPEFTSEALGRIQSAGGSGMEIQVLGYDAGNGLLTFNASSRQVIDVPSYILRMQETGMFHEVDYTGYTYENEWYTLSLSCTMEGKVVRGGSQ